MADNDNEQPLPAEEQTETTEVTTLTTITNRNWQPSPHLMINWAVHLNAQTFHLLTTEYQYRGNAHSHSRAAIETTTDNMMQVSNAHANMTSSESSLGYLYN